MKNFVSVFFLVIFVSFNPAYAAIKVSLLAIQESLALTAEDVELSATGTILSRNNSQMGLEISIGMGKYWQLILGYKARSFSFDDSGDLIYDETEFTSPTTEFGLRWIVFSRTALTFLHVSEEDIAFVVNGSQAELYQEKISSAGIAIDQILYLGESLWLGVSGGYLSQSTGDQIESRVATQVGGFANYKTKNWGELKLSYDTKSVTKEDSLLKFSENFSILTLSWSGSF